MSEIRISHLSKSYAGQQVLDDICLQIGSGEFVAVLGPSGSGKTTLLRTLAGFEPVGGGEIYLGDRLMSSTGRHLPPEQRQLGIVFQNYALWPHMTVAENVGYSLKIAKVADGERRQRIDSALELVGLQGYGQRRPADLSGGQRQRVALARCMVSRPQVVLLDEPLANLDVHLRAAMEAEFEKFHRHTQATLLYITHDQREAMALADRVVVMDQGRVMQFCSPEQLYRQPANAMVARFIGDGMVMPVADVVPDGRGRATARLCHQQVRVRCHGDRPLAEAQLAFHREDLRLAPPEAPGIAAIVRRVSYRGADVQIDCQIPQYPAALLSLNCPPGQVPAVGAAVSLALADGWVIGPSSSLPPFAKALTSTGMEHAY